MVLSEQIAEATVVDVLWSPSKDGYLKPRVQIAPLQLGGVLIEFATGFNAAFIESNKIGVGSVIELIRSGDVIPHIRGVLVPALQPKMPNVAYHWNDTHVDIIVDNAEEDETVQQKQIAGFFRGIAVDGLSAGNVARIVKAGFDTVPRILKMTVDDFLSIDGFQEKMAAKLYNGIQEKIAAASLVTLMSASNLFGRGFSDKKCEVIMCPDSGFPDILISKESPAEKRKKIASLKGMAAKSAEAFVEKIDEFVRFLKEAGLEDKLAIKETSTVINKTNPLFGKSVVMTGFRDAELQEALKCVGAKVSTSVSKNTFAVLVKEKDSVNGKANEARNLDIPLMTLGEFREKYLI
jgi:NAD-dependent DNA ligase